MKGAQFRFQVIVNPTITVTSEKTLDFFEGCLSLPGFSAVVPRAQTVRVQCLDEHGQPRTIEASGLVRPHSPA